MVGTLAIPLKGAQAYSGGQLDGRSLNFITGASAAYGVTQSTTTNATDNNTSTRVDLGITSGKYDTLWYKFTKPVSITAYQANWASGTLTTKFYDSDGNVIQTGTNPTSGVRTNISVSGVYGISVQNTHATAGMSIYEYDVFGTIDSTPPSNVSSLTTSNITKSAIRLNFTTPSSSDFDKYKIYRNGSLIYTSGSGISKSSAYIYTASGLTSGTSYTFKVTSVDTSGNESAGTSVTASTLDITPPAEVSGVSFIIRQ